jgi:hypothetical protein
MESVSQNPVEKTAKLTLLAGEVKLCVVRERLGQVQLDVFLSVEGIVSLCFLNYKVRTLLSRRRRETHLFQLILENICFIVLCLFLDLIVNQRNMLCSFLLNNPLLDCDLQNCFLPLSISNSLTQTTLRTRYF